VVLLARGTEDRAHRLSTRRRRTQGRYRTIQIRAGHHTLTAEDPLPPDLRNALDLIK
jgi:hypothetical protein